MKSFTKDTMQTTVLYLCYIVFMLLFSTAYNTSFIYCFVIWCLHTNKRRPCSSRSRAIRRLVSEGPQNSDDLIITDDFTWKQMFLKRSESKSLTGSNWPSSISVLLGRSLFVNYGCLPQKRFYIMAKLGFCFILEKYEFMQWMG